MILLERLLDLLAMGQQPQIGRHLVALWADAGEIAEDVGVDLPRIRLPADGVRGVEADLAADQFFQLAHLGVVAVEEFQEARLRAGGAFVAQGLEAGDAMLDFGQVHREIVRPETRPLADGRRLGRLKMGEPEAGQIAVLGGERGQGVDHGRHSPGDHLQALAQQQQVGVVGHVAACGAQVDDGPGVGAKVAVGVDVGHHVVPQLPLVTVGGLEVDVVRRGP